MLSIIILLFALFFISIFNIKRKSNFVRSLKIVLINLLLIEGIIYIYFIFQIYLGTCFFLIGNQKGLDAFIKARLIYSTYYATEKQSFYFQLNNDLGYTLGKNKTGKYLTSNQGLRGNKNYSLFPKQDTLRIAALGGSHTFCANRADDETWEHYMEEQAHNIEVLNFGIPGFGLGQTYLRYLKDAVPFHPDIIVLDKLLVTNEERLNFRAIINNRDLRSADLYRMFFWIDDKSGALLSKNITPYNLFDPNFRKKNIYDPLNFDLQKSIWSNKLFSNINMGLLIKQFAFKNFVISTENIRDFYDEDINYKILDNLLKTAEDNNTKVIFFLELPNFEKIPLKILDLLENYKHTATLIDGKKELEKIWAKNNVEENNLRDKTNHFLKEGNQYYAEAVLEILKNQNWVNRNKKNKFDKTTSSFIPLH